MRQQQSASWTSRMLNRTLKPMATPLFRIMTIISRLLTTTVSIMPAEDEVSPPDTTQTVHSKMTKMSINQMNQKLMGTLRESQLTKKDLIIMASHGAK